MTSRHDRAALGGSESSLLTLVSRSASEPQWVEWLQVPLEHAVAAGDSKLVANLICAGANARGRRNGCNGRTLLSLAAESGNQAVLSTLLDAAPDPDLNTTSGQSEWSPLHYAAESGHEDVAKMLISKGANVECVDRHQRSPLHIAIGGGYHELAQQLLSRGASPNAQDAKGNAPLHIASRLGYDSIVDLLLRTGAEVTAKDKSGDSPLQLAVAHNHLISTTTLLRAGANCRARNVAGYAALDLAACKGHVHILGELLRHGADANSSEDHGVTALHGAARCNQPAAVGVLVEAGANVEARISQSGLRPLHLAAGRDSHDAVLALLRCGAEINAQDSSGRRPLTLSCMYLSEASAGVLLRWGAEEVVPGSAFSIEREVVGFGINDMERSLRGKDIERLRALLALTPADRAWRRRGLMILCRAIKNQTYSRLVNPSGHGFGIKDRGNCARRGCNSCMAQTVVATETTNTVPPVDRGCSMAQDPNGYCNSLEARVARLEEDGIFRAIVMFL